MSYIAIHDSEAEHFKHKDKFPNYALMKISAYHKALGEEVVWFYPMEAHLYDKVYSSKVFDWTPQNQYLPDHTIKGGTGYGIYDDLLAIENLRSSFRVKEDREGEGRLTHMTATASCMWFSDMKAYLGDKDGWGWAISELKTYDKPKELSEFSKYGFEEPVPLKRPPQSWMYVEDNR